MAQEDIPEIMAIILLVVVQHTIPHTIDLIKESMGRTMLQVSCKGLKVTFNMRS